MADKKVIFVAFALEDERQRDLLKGQSLHTTLRQLDIGDGTVHINKNDDLA
jgi:hypothetical protein